MKLKQLPLFLVTGAIGIVVVTPSFAQPASTGRGSVKCETISGVPTTVAVNPEGERQSIFEWRQENLRSDMNAQTLCNDVSNRLNHYLNSRELKQTSISPSFGVQMPRGIPTVCYYATTSGYCNPLFTLKPKTNQTNTDISEIDNIFNKILARSLKDHSGTTSTSRADGTGIFEVGWFRTFIGR